MSRSLREYRLARARRTALALLFLLLVGFTIPALRAQSVSNWNGGNGFWSNNTLWTPMGAPNSSNADVFVDGGNTGVNSAVTLNASYIVGRLNIDAGDSVTNYDSMLVYPAGSLAIAAGGFAGSGTIINNGGSINSFTGGYPQDTYIPGLELPLVVSGNVTLTGTGVSRLGALTAGSGGGTFTIGGNQTVVINRTLDDGTVQLTNNGVLTNDAIAGHVEIRQNAGLTMVNNGTIFAHQESFVFALDGGGKFTNNGIFSAMSGAAGFSEISVAVGALTNYSSTTQTLTGGTYQVGAPLRLNASGEPMARNDGRDIGILDLGTGTGSIVTNAATINIFTPDYQFTALNGLANNQGTLTLTYGAHLVTAGSLVNSGTLSVTSGSDFGYGATHNGTQLVVNGTLTQTSSGRLTGGALDSVHSQNKYVATAFNLDGAIAPDPAGRLTLQGAVVLAPTIALDFTLGAPSTDNGRLVVIGNFLLDGHIDLAAVSGFGPGSYELIDYSGGSFTDAGLHVGNAPSGYTYTIDESISGQVDLIVAPANVPEPSTWALMLAGVGVLGAAQRLRRQR